MMSFMIVLTVLGVLGLRFEFNQRLLDLFQMLKNVWKLETFFLTFFEKKNNFH